MNYMLVFLAIFFVLVLGASTGVGCYRPYSMATEFQKHSPVEEGFTLDYSSRNGDTVMDTYKSHLIETTAPDCAKVYGFDNLFCAPGLVDNKLDVFSDASTTKSPKESSGLSKSTGAIVLTDDMNRLLTTRGGNMSDKPSQIG